MQQTSAIIYLNEQRGLIESSDSKMLCTFNYKEYFNRDKQAFGSIFLFNELVLDSCAINTNVIEENCLFIIIPVTGTLNYQIGKNSRQELEVGETLVNPCQKGITFNIYNPYPKDQIHLIQIGIKSDLKIRQQEKYPLDLASNPNELSEVFSIESKIKLSAGRFMGRKEQIYPLKKDSCHFLHTLSGAFEISGRLVHPGDSLVLWNTQKTEIEALSNEAVLISIETETPKIRGEN